jgi:hypothetical protein
MPVDVINRLTTVILGVHHRSEPVFLQTKLGRDPRDGGHNVAKEGNIFTAGFHEVGDMTFGNDEDMNRGSRLDIGKSDEVFVFVNDICRYFLVRDLAENTVLLHAAPPLARIKVSQSSHTLLLPKIFCLFIGYPAAKISVTENLVSYFTP